MRKPDVRYTLVSMPKKPAPPLKDVLRLARAIVETLRKK